MCGIAGIHRRTDAPMDGFGRLADQLLLAIEARGTDATGILALQDSGKVQLEKKTLRASKFVGQRRTFKTDTRTLLLHTRFATIGRREAVRNAHPHAAGTIACIHNGTIRNHLEVTQVFDLKRRAECDSEVIPAIVNYAGWAQAENALSLLEGGAAVALVDTDHPKEVILAVLRNYPLVYAVTDEVVVWASTEAAIRRAWQQAYGTPLPVACDHLSAGQIVRVNGEITSGRIPGIPEAAPIAEPAKFGYSNRPKKGKRKKGSPSVPPVARQMKTVGSFSEAREELERRAMFQEWEADLERARDRYGMSLYGAEESLGLWADVADATWEVLDEDEEGPNEASLRQIEAAEKKAAAKRKPKKKGSK